MYYDLLFIGCGNMGSAILDSVYNTDYKIAVIEKDSKKIQLLQEKYKMVDFFSSLENITEQIEAKILILSVKPQYYPEVIELYADKLSVSSVISIMAGVKLETLEKDFQAVPIARVMPNTPALYKHSASAYTLNTLGEEDETFREEVEKFLKYFGISIYLDREELIDVVTGLSGSGPAYMMVILEAMIDAAIKEGLSYQVARELAIQTMYGSAFMAKESNENISQLKYNVMSPGGTTSAGIVALESSGIRNAIAQAIIAATNKSRELGKK